MHHFFTRKTALYLYVGGKQIAVIALQWRAPFNKESVLRLPVK